MNTQIETIIKDMKIVCTIEKEYEVVDESYIYFSKLSFKFESGYVINITAQYDCGNSWVYYESGRDGDSAEYIANKFFCEILNLEKRDYNYNYDSSESKIYDSLLDFLEECLSLSEPPQSEEMSLRDLNLEDFKEEKTLFGISINNTNIVKFTKNDEIAVAIQSFDINSNNYTFSAVKFFDGKEEYKNWYDAIINEPSHCHYQDVNLVFRAIDSITNN